MLVEFLGEPLREMDDEALYDGYTAYDAFWRNAVRYLSALAGHGDQIAKDSLSIGQTVPWAGGITSGQVFGCNDVNRDRIFVDSRKA
jgi:hypothetical protein